MPTEYDPRQLSFSRRKKVLSRFGFSNTTLWRKIKAGEFPKPTYLGPQTPVWPDHELDAHAEMLLAQRDTAEA